MLEALKKLRQHLLTGVSFAIPFISCGGIMIAFAIALAPMTSTGPDFSRSPILKLILDIGSTSFALLLPVLAACTLPVPGPWVVSTREPSADLRVTSSAPEITTYIGT